MESSTAVQPAARTLGNREIIIAAMALIGAAVAILFATASSPEAARTRSGGPGADVGNRTAVVDLHGPLNPFYHTPPVGKSVM